MNFFRKLWRPAGVNSLDALKPEMWAFEAIRVLEEQMVMGGLVYRDYSPVIANFGDTVHVHKPATFKGRRKNKNENVTTQDASVTQVNVVLDQWVHVSFTLDDLERSHSFKNLVQLFLVPALQAEARFVDRALAARSIDALANVQGGLGQLSSGNAVDYLVDVGKGLTDQKCPGEGRNLVLNTTSSGNILKTDTFHEVDKSGWTRALRNANIGKAFGLTTFEDINVPNALNGTKGAGTTVDGAKAAGATVVTFDAAMAAGQYITIAGDNTPLRVKSVSTLDHTMTRPLKRAVADAAVVTEYEVGAVDLAAGYAAGFVGPIHVDGTGVPQVGQIVAFGTDATHPEEYVIIEVDSVSSDYEITLDRPLETALADDAIVNYGPDGDINLAFTRNAIALVNRPLAAPIEGVGARGFTAEHNGVSMRAVITYDGLAQSHRVTLDTLFGTKTLDTDLMQVMLG